ncbi:MAG: TolC family protein [Campylobacterota bacterium]|nr:TolC family protein [Campylobacterota bacterium]
MKFTIFLVLIFSVYANAYNLQEIKESLKSNNKTKSIKFKRDSQIAQSSLMNSYEAPVLGASLSHAKEPSNDGLEYSVGISQDIAAPFSFSSKNRATEQSTLALRQEAKHELHIIELEVSSKYYASCTSREIRDKSILLYKEQSKRFEQLENAYSLGEISKKDLLFNKLDLAKLSQNISRYELVFLEEFATLQESVDSLKIDKISCDDLVEPVGSVELRDINEHGELKTLEYKKNASKAMYEVHDSMLQTVGYELLYEQELETKRYTVGISIPLGVATQQREMTRSAELAMSSSYETEKESMKNKIHKSSMKLKSKLELIYAELKIMQDEILPLSQELLNLSKSALVEGEGSVMEYVDASRSYSENLLGMLELKKTYYYQLFELYKTADMQYGEER